VPGAELAPAATAEAARPLCWAPTVSSSPGDPAAPSPAPGLAPPEEPPRCPALLRTTDWSRTHLGPYEAWPQTLRGYVAMVLEMPTPAIIFWGPEQIQLYNDGYSVIMGPRHPRYFGAPYRECWPDTYPVIYPWMQKVLQGEVIEVERSLFVLTRHGFTEEAYFTFTFSPLRDDTGAITGILQPVVEVTQEVLAERRAETLRSLTPPPAVSDAARHVIESLAASPGDVPFALLYGPDSSGELRLRASCGIAAELAPERVPAAAVDAHTTGTPVVIDARQLLGGREHVGTWGEPTREAFVLPVTRSSADASRGVLVFGVSPRLAFDDRYRELFAAIARELAAGLDAEAAARAERALLERAEAARAEADAERRRLHTIFEQAPVAISILAGPAYVVEMANPLMCQLWNREPGAVNGKPLLEAIPELAGQGFDALLDGVRATGRRYIATERRVKLRRADDGSLEDRNFNFVYDPLADAAGRVTAVIVVATDVTLHVRARQGAEQLAAQLDRAWRDAEQARDDAQRASRAKDEFLAMLGHELRNPLAPIFTALELLRHRGVGAAHPREVEAIARQARHLAGLVEDLLDVSRITRGKIELRCQPLEIADVIGKAIETTSVLLEKRRHELSVDVPPGSAVTGDPARLTQVFVNLLTNAAKYTDPGGRITITARCEGAACAVEVRDTGCGISPEMLPRVFDLFEQEPQSLDRAQGGLGLGLAIVKSLVALHGGSVEARSEGRGRGSTFVVRLPSAAAHASGAPAGCAPADSAADADSASNSAATSGSPTGAPAAPGAAASATPATPGPERRGRTILIVDDNEDAATLLAEGLTRLGHACTIAHDGPRALELARGARFDTVLLDIGLPAMDGYEVARHLRALPGGADLELFALTGYSHPSDKERTLAAGFDHHLVKPVNLPTVAKLLDAGHARPARPDGPG
jgi:signal transduction histidine kinase/CheY-like chemotaxis protein